MRRVPVLLIAFAIALSGCGDGEAVRLADAQAQAADTRALALRQSADTAIAACDRENKTVVLAEPHFDQSYRSKNLDSFSLNLSSQFRIPNDAETLMESLSHTVSESAVDMACARGLDTIEVRSRVVLSGYAGSPFEKRDQRPEFAALEIDGDKGRLDLELTVDARVVLWRLIHADTGKELDQMSAGFTQDELDNALFGDSLYGNEETQRYQTARFVLKRLMSRTPRYRYYENDCDAHGRMKPQGYKSAPFELKWLMDRTSCGELPLLSMFDYQVDDFVTAAEPAEVARVRVALSELDIEGASEVVCWRLDCMDASVLQNYKDASKNVI